MARYNLKEDFFEWKKKYGQNNLQVVHLAGEPNLQVAKEVLRDKIDLIGFVDSIDDSVNFLNKWLGVNSLQNSNIKKKNSSPNHLRKNIIDNYHIYSEVINECNALDLQLYNFAKDIYDVGSDVWDSILSAPDTFMESYERHSRKKGGQVKKTKRKSRSTSRSKPRGVGKALRGYGAVAKR